MWKRPEVSHQQPEPEPEPTCQAREWGTLERILQWIYEGFRELITPKPEADNHATPKFLTPINCKIMLIAVLIHYAWG